MTLMVEALAIAHHVPAEALEKATTCVDYIKALSDYQAHLYQKGGTDTVHADGIVLGLQTLIHTGTMGPGPRWPQRNSPTLA